MAIDHQAIIDLLSSTYPFWKLDANSIALIAQKVSVKEISTGQILYRQGKNGDRLYIILKGRIELIRSEDKKRRVISTYKKGELIGLETVQDKMDRLSQAVATHDTSLLMIEKSALKDLVQKIPDLELLLKNLLNSLKLFKKVDINWLDGDEGIFIMKRRHPFHLVLRLIPPVIIALLMILPGKFLFNITTGVGFSQLFYGVFYILLFVWMLWSVMDWLNDYSIITNNRVVYLENVYLLYNSRLETPLNQIVSISIETSQIGRWLSYGDIIISTYTGRVILPMVTNPWQAVDFLDWGRSREQTRHSHLLPEEMESAINQRLGISPVVYTRENPEEFDVVEEYKGAFGDIFTHFFQMRYQKRDMIVYRKHWFILLKRLFVPTAFLFLIESSYLAKLFNIMPILSDEGMMIMMILGNLIVGAWWLYRYMDWGNDVYIITRDEIIDLDKKPLGHEERKTALIMNILSINSERLGLIGQLLNFGTVFIRVGDSDLTLITFSTLPKFNENCFRDLQAFHPGRSRIPLTSQNNAWLIGLRRTTALWELTLRVIRSMHKI